MTSWDDLYKKRLTLESIVQDSLIAGVEVPPEILSELDAVSMALSDLPRQQIATPKSWTQWLGQSINKHFIKRLLQNDSYAYTFAALGEQNSGIESSSADHPYEFVYKIAKPQELVLEPQKRPPSDNTTMVLKLQPFDTCEVTPDSKALIQMQYQRLNSCVDSAVMPVLSLDTIEDLDYYQMPFIKGTTLRQILSSRAPNNRLDILAHLVKCAQTLGRLSISTGFYHGNLKPDNILITDAGIVLTDPGYFGALKCALGMLPQAMVSTTAYYPLLVPDDLLALGILLYQTMTGINPFASDKLLMAVDQPSGPSILDSELTDEINFKRSILEPYLTPLLQLKRPMESAPWLTKEQETMILKGLRLNLGADGLLHKDKGFNDFADFASNVWTLLSLELQSNHSTKTVQAQQ